MIGAVPEEKETRRASRYDAVIATFVGVCALCVSAYTAHVQRQQVRAAVRSEEHTSELQSPCNLVCRLLLEKKKKTHIPLPVSFYHTTTNNHPRESATHHILST